MTRSYRRSDSPVVTEIVWFFSQERVPARLLAALFGVSKFAVYKMATRAGASARGRETPASQDGGEGDSGSASEDGNRLVENGGAVSAAPAVSTLPRPSNASLLQELVVLTEPFRPQPCVWWFGPCPLKTKRSIANLHDEFKKTKRSLRVVVCKTMDACSAKAIARMVAGGVTVKISTGYWKSGLAHHKYAQRDDEVVYNGSFNYTNSAQRRHKENVVKYDNVALAREFGSINNMEVDDAPTAALLGLAPLVPDALEDSRVAAYALIVVAPLCALAARLLRARGKATTFPHVLLVSLLVPGLLLGAPAWYMWQHGEWSVYRLLQMRRTESRYAWGQKYAFLRSLFQKGEMPAHVWHEVDAAYDHIYDEKRRVLYDFWGPDAAAMSLVETQLNVGLFYVLWAGVLFALTTPTRARDASKWVFTGLVALLCFEVAVKLMHYEPPFGTLFASTTPREFVVWGHRLFPIFALAVVCAKNVLFVDTERHRRLQLRHMLQQNEVAKSEFAELERRLVQEDDDADDNE